MGSFWANFPTQFLVFCFPRQQGGLEVLAELSVLSGSGQKGVSGTRPGGGSVMLCQFLTFDEWLDNSV